MNENEVCVVQHAVGIPSFRFLGLVSFSLVAPCPLLLLATFSSVHQHPSLPAEEDESQFGFVFFSLSLHVPHESCRV